MPAPSDLLASAREDLARGFTVRGGVRLRQAARAGDAQALNELCAALLSGRLPGGAAEARLWLERAGDRLDADARFLRAGLRNGGIGGTVSVPGALDDLARAAVAGLAAAQIETAMLWREWPGAEAQAAARYWLSAAVRNDRRSEALLGLLDEPIEVREPIRPMEELAPVSRAGGAVLSSEPRVERFESALAPIECAWLRLSALPFLEPSRVFDPATGAVRANPVRTSEAMCFDPAKPGIFSRRIAARLAALAGIDPACAEPLAVLRYRPGQEYKPHHDGLSPEALARDRFGAAGNRVATVLAYLNAPEAGGATIFPRLDVRVAPGPGNALVFFNLDAAGNPSPFALHAGEPVVAGDKWVASLWLRTRQVA